MRIAILDDDPAQIAHLVSLLKSPLVPGDDPVHCATFAEGRALRRALQRETFDLLILDWNVPDLGGIDLLRWLRDEKRDATPVLMLSSRSCERDVALALSSGADDYVVKPFRPLELRARLSRLQAGRSGGAASPISTGMGHGHFNAADNTMMYRSGDPTEGAGYRLETCQGMP